MKQKIMVTRVGVILMKSIMLILLATAIIASLAVGTTIQAQAKSPNAHSQYIYNQHSHSDITGLKGNDGSVTNTDEYHSNINDNTNREGDTPEERSNVNTHDKPNNGK
jgi:FlaG/FlaF family flagellin (archaellin)